MSINLEYPRYYNTEPITLPYAEFTFETIKNIEIPNNFFKELALTLSNFVCKELNIKVYTNFIKGETNIRSIFTIFIYINSYNINKNIINELFQDIKSALNINKKDLKTNWELSLQKMIINV